MKLHLPKMLTAALFAAFTVLAANTTVQAETTAPVYSGQIITWNNATNANPGDLAHGNYRITTYESGSFIVSSQDITGWGTAGSGPGGQLISKDTMEDRNTLRFAADTYGQTQKNPVYTFNPLVLAGIIVDDGAEGYSISTTSTGSDRNIYLGNKNSTAAYSSINEDFTINKAHGGGKVYLRGTQTIDVASDKTYTINSNNGFEISGALTVQGGGTLKLSGATTLASTITNNGTVNFNGTVSITDFTGFQGESFYSDDKNGYLLSARYTLWEGEGTTIGLDTVKYGTSTLTVQNKAISIDDADYNTYHVNTGVVSASAAYEDGHTPTAFQMAADTVLTIDRDVEATVTGANKTSSLVMIDGSNTLTGTASTVTIGGTGTYVLTSGTSGLGTNVLLATGEGWKGTVRLSGVSGTAGNDLNLNTYGHAGSKVEINGFTGFFLKAQAEFAPELVLGANGLTLNNGYSDIGGATRPPTKFTFAGGVSGEGDMTFNRPVAPGASTVTQHLYFTGDVKNWTGSLNVVSLFNVYAQYSGADQKVNSTISRTGGELHVEVGTGSDASVVTFSKAITADDLTVKAGATAYINGGLTTSTITVDEGATLAINGNTTLTSAITSAGTVTLTDVALSNAFTESQGGEAKYYIEETQNYYMGSADKYLTVVTGEGAANATGTGLTWNTRSDLKMANGQVITGAGEANYSTLFVGGNTTSADIVGYGHKDALTNIVVESGTLTLTEGELPQTVAITVSEHGTIAGDVAPEEVTIAAGAKAEFTAAVEPVEGIRFTADEGETVKVTNNGETATKYDMASGATLNKDLSVEAKRLEVLQADMYIINNAVVVDEIIDNYSNTWLSLGNVQSLQLTNLVIADDSMMQVLYKDEEQASQEGTVTITESLVAGGATLYANLTLVGHELGDETPNLLYWDLNGAGANALTLGSTLTLNTESGLIQLDDDTMQAIAALGNRGEFLELVLNGGEPGTLEYIGDGWFNGVFSRTYTNAEGVESTLGGDYNVQLLDNGNFGIVKVSDVPEPTTGTLSLLALAALAARRRRK